MSIPAIQGLCHNGKIELLEEIPYKVDKKVLIVFLEDDLEDKAWDNAVAADFMKGYSKKDSAYASL